MYIIDLIIHLFTYYMFRLCDSTFASFSQTDG